MGTQQSPDTILDYRSRINDAVVYIEENAAEALTIGAIAARACMSPYHFHRIFTAFTGETLGECCRRIRMRKAMQLLMAGQTTEAVALETGYQTASAFIRVFKSSFGAPPSRFRQMGVPAAIRYPLPPVKEGKNQHVPIPVLKDLPDLHFYYVRRKGRKHENYTAAADEAFNVLFEKVWNWYEDPFALMRLGIIRDLELLPLEERRFDAALVIPEQVPRIPLKELHRDQLPGGRFAIFTHKGPYDSLWQTWSRIYRNWYPVSGLTLRDTPPFEIYHNSPMRTPPQELVTDICIPLNN